MGRRALTATVATSSERAAPTRGRGAHRRDIQALRALAVGCVLAFHLWPERVPGGYVGVDVFFVVSGFLITGLLLREREETGRIALGQFWARRARRLLPASLLVLAVTAALTAALVPVTRWASIAREIAAATLYIENWALAAASVDYLGAESSPSPVQHYWSLSVEEQFYFVWPIALAVLAALAGRRMREVWALAGGSAVVASLAWSVHLTAQLPGLAYFVTPTRVWEFAAGGLVALAPALVLGARARAALGWGGVAAIVFAALFFTGATAFPGWRALVPVLGAIAIIVAASEHRWSPMVVGRRRAVQRLGDLSYSVYLWHWPLLVIAPAALGRDLGNVGLLAVVVATVLLAEVTYRAVEQPVRQASALTSRRPAWTFAAAAVASALVLLAALALTAAAERAGDAAARVDETLRASAIERSCFGADALAEGPGCEDPSLAGVLLPSPVTAHGDGVRTCMQDQTRARVRVCESGVAESEAVETVALVGDSHTVHWIPAIRTIAAERGWRVLEITKGSCPFTAASRSSEPAMSESCERWNARVLDHLAAHPEITRVITSASSLNEFVPTGGRTPFATAVAGYRDAWAAVPGTVTRIDAIRDAPRPRPDVVDCVAALPSAEAEAGALACARPAADALLPDPLAAAARAAGGRVRLVDLSDLFCVDGTCAPVVGHAMLYRDGHHLTRTYVETLAPHLAARMGLS